MNILSNLPVADLNSRIVEAEGLKGRLMRGLSDSLESRATEEKTFRSNRYSGKIAVLTTKHGKLEAIRLPLKAGLGLEVISTSGVDTDMLGTFTGEVERVGSPMETARKKARLGMRLTGEKLGIANEGSFGPHPYVPFIAGCQEIMVFIDDELGIHVTESVVSEKTNFAHADVRSVEELEDFLCKVKFPSHGLIVRPNRAESNWVSKVSQIVIRNSNQTTIHKGIQDKHSLAEAIAVCAEVSSNGLAHVETDMRAHMNPTRQRVLRALTIKLARRLHSICPECRCPGWGISGVEGFLPCQDCGYPSDAPAYEVHSCFKCQRKEVFPRKDGLKHIDPTYCQRCNP